MIRIASLAPDLPPGLPAAAYTPLPPAPADLRPASSDSPAQTVRQWIATRYAPEQLPGRKHLESRKLCHTACNHLRTFFGHDPRLDELDRRAMKRWLAWMAFPPEEDEQFRGRLLSPSPKLAKATANKNLGHILASINYAADDEVIPHPARIKKFRLAKRKKRSWRPSEIALMLAAAVKVSGCYGTIPARKFWIALILTAYDTGLRIAALMALRWQDYDPELCAVLADADTQKHDADQWLGVKRRTAEAIEAIRGGGPRIFAWPFDHVVKGDRPSTYATLRRHFKRDILTPAGLPTDTQKPFHRFRRSSGTQIHKAGGDATKQLGHSSPAVTANYLDREEIGPLRGCDLTPDIAVPTADTQMRLFE